MERRSIPVEEILDSLRVAELKDVCRKFGLPISQTKRDDLVSAILHDKAEALLNSNSQERKLDNKPVAGINSLPRNNAESKIIEQYTHSREERLNNPPVGLVTPQTDKDGVKKTYAYDPHLDPQLQWAGKAEHTSFEVPTVSLHVHERIDPKRIIEQVKKEEKKEAEQTSLFETQERPLREAVEFYKHKDGWTNRLIAGDSLLVMN